MNIGSHLTLHDYIWKCGTLIFNLISWKGLFFLRSTWMVYKLIFSKLIQIGSRLCFYVLHVQIWQKIPKRSVLNDQLQIPMHCGKGGLSTNINKHYLSSQNSPDHLLIHFIPRVVLIFSVTLPTSPHPMLLKCPQSCDTQIMWCIKWPLSLCLPVWKY